MLVQHFAYRGSSQRRHSAARPLVDIVWLYWLAYSSGEGGRVRRGYFILTLSKKSCSVFYPFPFPKYYIWVELNFFYRSGGPDIVRIKPVFGV